MQSYLRGCARSLCTCTELVLLQSACSPNCLSTAVDIQWGENITCSRYWVAEIFCLPPRTTLLLTKRTPCFLPTGLFPLRKAARTIWSTTRTSDPSRSPKWGGRNELSIRLKEQTSVCLSGLVLRHVLSEISSQRGAVRQSDQDQDQNQQLLVPVRSKLSCPCHLCTDWIQLKVLEFCYRFLFPGSTQY